MIHCDEFGCLMKLCDKKKEEYKINYIPRIYLFFEIFSSNIMTQLLFIIF